MPAPTALRRWKELETRPALAADDTLVAYVKPATAGSASARKNEIEQPGGGLAQRDGRAWNQPDPD
jgi:hypothetical protein